MSFYKTSISKGTTSYTPKILDTPAPEVGMPAYDSHNIIIAVRPYVIPDDFWVVTFEVYQRIKHFTKTKYSEGVKMGNIGD